MIRYRGEWIVPVAGGPLRSAQVTIDRGRVVSVDHTASLDAVDLGRVAVLPGLVNTHTHLELSYLRDTIPKATCFTDWMGPVMRARRDLADPRSRVVIQAAEDAIREAKACGTAAVGDISNTLVTGPLLADADMAALVFHELIGFDVADPTAMVAEARRNIDAQPAMPGVRWTLAAHAPYSVSPGLFAALRADLEQQAFRVSSVHLGESAEEVELLRSGTGPWRTLLRELGVVTDSWPVPGVGPVDYLESLGFLGRDVMAVHGVQFGGSDLARLRALDATLVSCPRSNAHVGVGAPPLEAFYAAGVRVAFGTDSLASVGDLNLFAELHAARKVAPLVPAKDLIGSATVAGARALGLEADLGTIEPGKRAKLVAVRIPAGVEDVEEFLVSGVSPDAIDWLPDGMA